jgi:hypothetical protein
MIQQGLREQPGIQKDKFFMLTTSGSVAPQSGHDFYFWGATAKTATDIGSEDTPLATMGASTSIMLEVPVKCSHIHQSGTAVLYYTKVKQDLG